MKDKIDWSKVVDVALIIGIVYLAAEGKEGWGWLLFLLFMKQ
jgi:hypothetical protein